MSCTHPSFEKVFILFQWRSVMLSKLWRVSASSSRASISLSAACSLMACLNFLPSWSSFSDSSNYFKASSFVISNPQFVSRSSTALDWLVTVVFLLCFGGGPVSSSCSCCISSFFKTHLWRVSLTFLVKCLPQVSQTYLFPEWAIRLWRSKLDLSVYFFAQRSQA